ncbi:hypothetical protein [Amycolatopsis sp. WAC 01375]|nr:hypothetical protein [Amycolatopsis sp. WAC 01375]
MGTAVDLVGAVIANDTADDVRPKPYRPSEPRRLRHHHNLSFHVDAAIT